jgi:carbon-monoxide dehydrogenase small subunit
MKQVINLKINNEPRDVVVEARSTLLEILREQLGLTGVKESCNTGDCGTCTVLLDNRPALACLVLGIRVQGKSIVTIEGLANGLELHPLQKSFLEKGAVQCGYCTPGMILSAKALLDRIASPSRQTIQKHLEGNLCRCTGYNKIIDAVLEAGSNTTKEK